MPDEVKSAQLTADWENKLLAVERARSLPTASWTTSILCDELSPHIQCGR